MVTFMEKKLLTTGEFAKFAHTTKRTLQFYDTQGILKPFTTSNTGYRYYKSEQIVDFQLIVLLRRMNFSLPEIKKHVKSKISMKELFHTKKLFIEQEIARLQKTLSIINAYYTNLDKIKDLDKRKKV